MTATTSDISFSDSVRIAAKRALGGGLAGMAAMTIQVVTLMPLRTSMNYQYRYGSSMRASVGTLWAEGGLRRFYRGLAPALVQAPLSRFGDTASNAFALSLLSGVDVPVAIKTIAVSTLAASFRILLVPVDTLKTILQVEGSRGLGLLRAKVGLHGASSMFHGALASSAATFAGHWPWFATYNTLQEAIPVPKGEDALLSRLARNAGIGFVSSVVSDTISNSLRVIKTYRQTSSTPVSYPTAVREIIAADGMVGLFGRGLQTRILANGLQGLLFSVLWKAFEDAWKAREAREEARAR